METYRRLQSEKCDNNRAPFSVSLFSVWVPRLASNTLGHFVQLVIPMMEHQLQMPVSLADPLAADESYFSSTDWDVVLQIKKKKKSCLGKALSVWTVALFKAFRVWKQQGKTMEANTTVATSQRTAEICASLIIPP